MPFFYVNRSRDRRRKSSEDESTLLALALANISVCPNGCISVAVITAAD